MTTRSLAAMIRRVGRSPKIQLRWLVERFARQDVPGLFDEKLAQAGWELAVFLAADTDDDSVLRERLAVLRRVARRSNLISIVCNECWRAVTDGLTAMDGERGWRLTVPQKDVVGRWSDETEMFSWKEPDPWDFSRVQPDIGEFVELFEERIYETLGAEARRLRICLECRKPFVANGRQQYCRQGCSQTRRTRDWAQAPSRQSEDQQKGRLRSADPEEVGTERKGPTTV